MSVNVEKRRTGWHIPILTVLLVVVTFVCSILVFPKWWDADCRRFYKPDATDLVYLQIHYDDTDCIVTTVNGIYKVELNGHIYWVNDAIYQSILRAIFSSSAESVRSLDGSYTNVTATLEYTACPIPVNLSSENTQNDWLIQRTLNNGRYQMDVPTDYGYKLYTLSDNSINKLNKLFATF